MRRNSRFYLSPFREFASPPQGIIRNNDCPTRGNTRRQTVGGGPSPLIHGQPPLPGLIQPITPISPIFPSQRRAHSAGRNQIASNSSLSGYFQQTGRTERSLFWTGRLDLAGNETQILHAAGILTCKMQYLLTFKWADTAFCLRRSVLYELAARTNWQSASFLIRPRICFWGWMFFAGCAIGNEHSNGIIAIVCNWDPVLI